MKYLEVGTRERWMEKLKLSRSIVHGSDQQWRSWPSNAPGLRRQGNQRPWHGAAHLRCLVDRRRCALVRARRISNKKVARTRLRLRSGRLVTPVRSSFLVPPRGPDKHPILIIDVASSALKKMHPVACEGSRHYRFMILPSFAIAWIIIDANHETI
ncbi:hypothetical protein BDV30DRAFT_199962 [Aspergillus minisclerotigenes]|uniref:Uncharacterized protein n=1 Tax=Aspergillus minisclerotigenes TaxID=656917 RepID=A0A5N6IR45_9EURO|nr:hypothetical protein BDV30DRAFT_199962 [Aspergillus minisclerotigenes]